MSLIDTLKPKVGPKPPSAAQIEQQLPAQQQIVLELEAAIGQAALDALSGDQEAVERHRKVKVDLLAAHDKLALLNAAHAGAIERDRAQLEASREAIRKTQRESCRRHLAMVAKDADALAASVETTVRLYQEMLDRVQKAHAATPIGTKIADDTLCAPGKLRQFLVGELFRLSASAAGPSIGRSGLLLFPGASSPSVDFDDNVSAIPPFTEQVRREIAAFVAAIKEQTE